MDISSSRHLWLGRNLISRRRRQMNGFLTNSHWATSIQMPLVSFGKDLGEFWVRFANILVKFWEILKMRNMFYRALLPAHRWGDCSALQESWQHGKIPTLPCQWHQTAGQIYQQQVAILIAATFSWSKILTSGAWAIDNSLSDPWPYQGEDSSTSAPKCKTDTGGGETGVGLMLWFCISTLIQRSFYPQGARKWWEKCWQQDEDHNWGSDHQVGAPGYEILSQNFIEFSSST